jgi:putative hemolysin
MTEASLMSSRRSRLEAAHQRGSVGSARAILLLDQPTRFLSTVQVGITLIGIGAGAIGEKTIADRMEPLVREAPYVGAYSHVISSVIMVVFLTYFSLILGELVPKRLALLAPEAIAAAMAGPMNVLSAAARPLVSFLAFSTDLLIGVLPFGRVRKKMDEQSAEAEVKAILATGAREGVFHESEHKIVERVFRLSDQTAKSLMVPRTDIDWLNADDPVARVRVAVATSTHSHFPVCKAGSGLDALLGVVHVKDLVKAGLITDDITLGELARPPAFVPENTPALELLELFRENREHIVFVADEHGTLEGLVTLNDVTTAIIGEVSRENVNDDPPIVKRAENSYLLDGMLPVDDLKRLLGFKPDDELPKQNEGYETLGGFVMTYLGHIPATGDVLEWRAEGDAGARSDKPNFRMEVVDMDRKRVDKVLLTIIPPASDDGQNREPG